MAINRANGSRLERVRWADSANPISNSDTARVWMEGTGLMPAAANSSIPATSLGSSCCWAAQNYKLHGVNLVHAVSAIPNYLFEMSAQYLDVAILFCHSKETKFAVHDPTTRSAL